MNNTQKLFFYKQLKLYQHFKIKITLKEQPRHASQVNTALARPATSPLFPPTTPPPCALQMYKKTEVVLKNI